MPPRTQIPRHHDPRLRGVRQNGPGGIPQCLPVTYADLTAYDAVVGGYENLEDLTSHLVKQIPVEKTPEKTEFYKILYRWL